MPNIKIKLSLECEECSSETITEASNAVNQIENAINAALEHSGANVHITKTTTESGTKTKIVEITEADKLREELRELTHAKSTLEQLLLDADEVARRRGDKHGLCDALDNDGDAYPSGSSTALVELLLAQGRKPMLFLKDL
jgi:hypothetical protein